MKPLLLASLALLLANGAAGQPQPKSGPAKKRDDSMEQIIREAGLDLRKPTPEAVRNAGAILRKADKKGIWIAAPTPLAIDRDRGVSITGFDFYDTQDRGRRFLADTGIVVATRVESRETFAALINERKEPSDPDAAPDTRPIPPSEVVQAFDINLLERLPDLPWRAGTYIVDVILDTQTSNRLRFHLTPGAAAAKDPAVAAYIDANRGGSASRDLLPSPSAETKYPDYRRHDASLAVPSSIGIALSPERVSVYKPGAHSVLKGSFRLPVTAASYRAATRDSTAATAAVPITLVITGNLLTGPFVVPLRVATYDRIERNSPESTVTGHFEIDLFALRETSKVPQTYTIWAYSGTVRSTPATAAIVTPDSLK